MKITKNKDGTLSARAYIGRNTEGKLIQKRITAKSKSELYAIIENEKSLIGKAEKGMTLRKAMDAYCKSRSHVLSPSTYKEYIRYSRYVFIDIQGKDIQDITNEMVQAEVNKAAIDKSPKTVRNYYGFFSTVMKAYSDKRYAIRLPQKVKTSVFIPNEEQIVTLLNKVRGTSLELPVLLGCKCGLRRSEISALTYDDFDFKNKTVTISKAMVKGSEEKYVLKQPKSFAGYRTVAVPDSVLKIVMQRKKEGKDLLTINSNSISHKFNMLVKKIDMEGFRFHNLRHYYATRLLELNIPNKYAMEMLGHSTEYMLREVYQHIRKDKKEEYMQLITSALD